MVVKEILILEDDLVGWIWFVLEFMWFSVNFYCFIKEFKTESNIEKTLDNFCQYQAELNENMANHDLAVMITQLEDIYK